MINFWVATDAAVIGGHGAAAMCCVHPKLCVAPVALVSGATCSRAHIVAIISVERGPARAYRSDKLRSAHRKQHITHALTTTHDAHVFHKLWLPLLAATTSPTRGRRDDGLQFVSINFAGRVRVFACASVRVAHEHMCLSNHAGVCAHSRRAQNLIS